MPKANITQDFVNRARPRDGRADDLWWDKKLEGFGLRVKLKGGAQKKATKGLALGTDDFVKSYVIQYRNERGRSRRMTVGQDGRLTAHQARHEAKLKLGDVDRGKDPVALKNEVRGAMTVTMLCRDHYLPACDKGLILGKRKHSKKASTVATDRGRIERHIIPLLGEKAVREVTGADVTKFLRDVTAGKTAADVKTKKRGRAIVEGGAGTAARTVGLLGGIFSYAVSEGLRHDNPVRGVARPAGKRRKLRLDVAGYKKLGEALAEAEAEEENPAAIAAVRLLALTGCRLGEITHLKKAEIDRERQALRFADSKEGESIRPLTQAAIRVLDELPDALRVSTCQFMLPGDDGKRAYAGLPKAIGRIMERKKDLSGVTAHTLRHSFASLSDDLGLTEPTIAALLGHGSGSVTRRYIHKLDPALVAAADRVANLIELAMAGKVKNAEVVSLEKQSA